MRIRLRTLVVFRVPLAVGLGAAVNWPLFTARSPVSLLYSVELPLGLAALVLVTGLSAIYLPMAARVDAGALLATRRLTRDLEQVRTLALSAEAAIKVISKAKRG